MNWFRIALACALGAGSAIGQVPDLALLKRAAESGNAEAQFRYAQTFSASSGRRDWLLAAANQGHGPAEDQLAWEMNWSLFSTHFPKEPLRSTHLRKNSAQMRDALAWAALAADKGFPRSRLLLAFAYANGYVVPADPLEAYKWLTLARDLPEIARISSGGLKERLIKSMSLEEVQAAERRAAAYRPGNTAPTIYRQIVLPSLKLNGTATMNGETVALINGKRIKPGEQVEVIADGVTIQLYLVSVERNAATITLPPMKEEFVLRNAPTTRLP